MLRPRGGPEVQVLQHALRCSPTAEVAWAQDVFGNPVATARFDEQAGELVVGSYVGAPDDLLGMDVEVGVTAL